MPDTPDRYDRNNSRHRIMVDYAAMGHTADAIADATGYATAYVQAILRSPLFQTEVAAAQQEIRVHALSRFARTIGESMLPAATTLSTIAADSNEKAADRIAASKAIIGTGLEMYLPKRKDDSDRTVRLVVESKDLKLVADALTEEDAAAALLSPDSLAAEMESACAVPARVRAMSIEDAAAALADVDT